MRTTRVVLPWTVKLICRLCYTGHTKNITSIMVYRKYSSFNTNNCISFNNVYTTLVNKYRTIYWVLMTIPRALGFVWGWGRLSSYYSEILSMNQNECLWKMWRFLHTLKTIFIDPRKEEANCVPYNMLHFSPVLNSQSGCEVVQLLPHSILLHEKFAAVR